VNYGKRKREKERKKSFRSGRPSPEGIYEFQTEIAKLSNLCRTINPLDKETILKSVKKTNKVLIAHEDNITAGFSAEISAIIADEAFEFLDAPVKRIGATNTPIPYSPPLENAVLPQESWILQALEELAKY